MKWIAVADQAPPKDRVIIVTSGFSWVHKDIHFPAREGRDARSEYTHRSWNIRGQIAYAIWHQFEKEDMWIEPGRWSRLPEFTHWCECENPFGEDAKPPRGLTERFDGDARLDENTAAVIKQEEWRDNLTARLDDPRESEMGKASLTNQIARLEEHLEKLRAIRDRSYNPYPLSK